MLNSLRFATRAFANIFRRLFQFFEVTGLIVLLVLLLGGSALVWAWQNEDLQPLVAAVAGGAAVVLAAVAGFTTSTSARIILVSAAGAFAVWFSWYSVKDLTDQLKEKTQLAERRQQRLQLALDDIVDYIKPLPKEEYRKALTTAGYDKLRKRFQNALKHKPPFSTSDFEASEDIIYVLQKLETNKNGHALYIGGEILWALRHPDSESQFYMYLEQENKYNTRNGVIGAEQCRTPEGYCRERTAWIFHQLARNFLEQGNGLKAAGKPEQEYKEKFAEALKHACSAIKLFPGHGFSQPPSTRSLERSLYEGIGKAIPQEPPQPGACL
jgi:hypothetical protein